MDKTTDMTNLIYNPITIKVSHSQIVFIRVDKKDYFPIYLLPMDAERGRDGFPTTQKTVERDICDVIAKDYTGGLPEDFIAILNGDVKASLNINTNLPSFAVKGLNGKVPCLSLGQFTEVVLSYARNKNCEFCWDLLDMFLFGGMMRTTDSTIKSAKFWPYDNSYDD